MGTMGCLVVHDDLSGIHGAQPTFQLTVHTFLEKEENRPWAKKPPRQPFFLFGPVFPTRCWAPASRYRCVLRGMRPLTALLLKQWVLHLCFWVVRAWTFYGWESCPIFKIPGLRNTKQLSTNNKSVPVKKWLVYKYWETGDVLNWTRPGHL